MSSNPSDTPNGAGQADGNASGRRRFNHAKNRKLSNQFKGETPGMQGKVFRLQSEQVKKGEFKETEEAMERYAARAYPLDTAKLQTVFK